MKNEQILLEMERLAELVGSLQRRVEILENDTPVKSISELHSDFEAMKIKKINKRESGYLNEALKILTDIHLFQDGILPEKIKDDIEYFLNRSIKGDIKKWRDAL